MSYASRAAWLQALAAEALEAALAGAGEGTPLKSESVCLLSRR